MGAERGMKRGGGEGERGIQAQLGEAFARHPLCVAFCPFPFFFVGLVRALAAAHAPTRARARSQRRSRPLPVALRSRPCPSCRRRSRSCARRRPASPLPLPRCRVALVFGLGAGVCPALPFAPRSVLFGHVRARNVAFAPASPSASGFALSLPFVARRSLPPFLISFPRYPPGKGNTKTARNTRKTSRGEGRKKKVGW